MKLEPSEKYGAVSAKYSFPRRGKFTTADNVSILPHRYNRKPVKRYVYDI